MVDPSVQSDSRQEPGQSPGKAPTPTQQYGLGAIDGFLAWILPKLGVEGIDAELRESAAAPRLRIKVGKFLVRLLIALFVIAGFGYSLSSCRRNEAAEAKSNLAEKYKQDRDQTERENRNLVRENEGLKRDRDTLNLRFQMAELKANLPVQTNMPPDRRLDAILERLQLLGPDAFECVFYVNRIQVTNESVVVLGTNRALHFEVKNLSRMTVENLTLTFSPLVHETNFAYGHWKVRGSTEWFSNDKPVGMGPVLETIYEVSAAPNSFFVAEPITISKDCKSSRFRATLSAYANRSAQRYCHISVVLTPE